MENIRNIGISLQIFWQTCIIFNLQRFLINNIIGTIKKNHY